MRNKSVFTALVLIFLGGIVVLAKSPDLVSTFIHVFQTKSIIQPPAKSSPAASSTPVTPGQGGTQSGANGEANKAAAIPEQVTWLFLFRQLTALEDKAREAENKGEDGSRYRTLYKRIANITDQQNDLLTRTALDCMTEVKIKDALAKQVITRLRAEHQPDINLGKAPDAPPPLSPELADLQKQRDEIILRYRGNLKNGFGIDFDRFEAFVHQNITSNITPNLKGKPAAPALKNRNLSVLPQSGTTEGNR